MDEKKISVLTCDDSAFVRMMVKDILEKSDFDCIGEATPGIQAVEAVQRLEPEAVKLGARGFVTKPFSPQTLLKELRQALTSREEQESPRPSV